MYVCGPTVDNLPHLGHGRFTLVWDIARRWFTFRGLDVNYVSNITDIEDKIIARSLQEGRSTAEVVATYEGLWWEAMDQLGVARPDEAPHATDWVPQMIELISGFLENDIATSSVMASISTSRASPTTDSWPASHSTAFAPVTASKPSAKSVRHSISRCGRTPNRGSRVGPPLRRRPTRLAHRMRRDVLGLLGDDFDLHCGGLDLKFPHHENERAQAVAAGRVFSRHWSHNGLVMVGGEKMSKSLGNFTSLTHLAETSDPRAYRLLVLRSHYRSPLEVTTDTIADAERALARLDAFARRFELPALAGDTLEVASQHRFEGDGEALYLEVGAVLDDDLKTPLAVALLFDALASANSAADGGDGRGPKTSLTRSTRSSERWACRCTRGEMTSIRSVLTW